jgi:hypothetical protein
MVVCVCHPKLCRRLRSGRLQFQAKKVCRPHLNGTKTGCGGIKLTQAMVQSSVKLLVQISVPTELKRTFSQEEVQMVEKKKKKKTT